MATDGDKIAAATLTAALVAKDAVTATTAALISTYGDFLQRIVNINPDTGEPFTPDENRRRRQQSNP